MDFVSAFVAGVLAFWAVFKLVMPWIIDMVLAFGILEVYRFYWEYMYDPRSKNNIFRWVLVNPRRYVPMVVGVMFGLFFIAWLLNMYFIMAALVIAAVLDFITFGRTYEFYKKNPDLFAEDKERYKNTPF
jgi:hypothetical protein